MRNSLKTYLSVFLSTATALGSSCGPVLLDGKLRAGDVIDHFLAGKPPSFEDVVGKRLVLKGVASNQSIFGLASEYQRTGYSINHVVPELTFVRREELSKDEPALGFGEFEIFAVRKNWGRRNQVCDAKYAYLVKPKPGIPEPFVGALGFYLPLFAYNGQELFYDPVENLRISGWNSFFQCRTNGDALICLVKILHPDGEENSEPLTVRDFLWFDSQ